MRVLSVSETLHGGPMVEVDEIPCDTSGALHVSDDLVSLLKPYMNGRDNVAVRFTSDGLPTTATVVISESFTKNSPDTVRWYAILAILFQTKTLKTGLNLRVQPIRSELFKLGVQQIIEDGPWYNFQEVYNNMEHSSSDLDRLLKIAEDHYSRSLQQRSPD
ncbi:hypothetical protein [Labrys sp. 22185]|uniref:hypothetical protein n=1 Tax=Labrys sp. 22185 TaxID=3453888 RepID=UPI003F85C766